jgi:hypothetical protein
VTTPKAGMKFLHSRQITKDREPETCTITKVARGTVYFRNSTGFLTKTPVDRIDASVKEWIKS